MYKAIILGTITKPSTSSTTKVRENVSHEKFKTTSLILDSWSSISIMINVDLLDKVTDKVSKHPLWLEEVEEK